MNETNFKTDCSPGLSEIIGSQLVVGGSVDAILKWQPEYQNMGNFEVRLQTTHFARDCEIAVDRQDFPCRVMECPSFTAHIFNEGSDADLL